MFGFLLCDSLLCGHKSSGIKLHSLRDEGEVVQSCLCIASGGGLVLQGGNFCPESAIGLAIKSLRSEPVVRSRLAKNPRARIIVLNAERSTTKCRGGHEQFPRIVQDRNESALIKSLETHWTICDLEDVVQERHDRKSFVELEGCKLRHGRGIYGQKGDDLHFRKDIAVAAGDELMKALWRTALRRYGDGLKNDGILIILAAGWNADGHNYYKLDANGHAWRKAELVALSELCALNGHPVASVFNKMEDLAHRLTGGHHWLLNNNVRNIAPIKPPDQKDDVFGGCIGGGHLEHWLKNRKRVLENQTDVGIQKRRSTNRLSKLEEDVRLLADATGLPRDTAEGILESVGSVSAGLALDMFHANSRPQTKFSQTLVSLKQVIDICDSESDNEIAEIAPPYSADSVSHLTSMGFSKSQASEALSKCSGDLMRAIDVLLRGE